MVLYIFITMVICALLLGELVLYDFVISMGDLPKDSSRRASIRFARRMTIVLGVLLLLLLVVLLVTLLWGVIS